MNACLTKQRSIPSPAFPPLHCSPLGSPLSGHTCLHEFHLSSRVVWSSRSLGPKITELGMERPDGTPLSQPTLTTFASTRRPHSPSFRAKPGISQTLILFGCCHRNPGCTHDSIPVRRCPRGALLSHLASPYDLSHATHHTSIFFSRSGLHRLGGSGLVFPAIFGRDATSPKAHLLTLVTSSGSHPR